MGLHITAAVRALHPPHFEWNTHFDRLMGTSRTREQLEVGRAPDDLIAEWAEVEAAFARARAAYLLYD
jgi:uncharacterized protein YbbC (DUF1343 family)